MQNTVQQHTPGDWRVANRENDDENCDYLTIESDHGTLVGDEGFWIPPDEGTSWANAHMMAASPKLYQALKGILAATESSAISKEMRALSEAALAAAIAPNRNGATLEAI